MNNMNERWEKITNEYKYKVTATSLTHSSASNGLQDSERWYGNFSIARVGGISPGEERIEELGFSQCDDSYALRL